MQRQQTRPLAEEDPNRVSRKEKRPEESKKIKKSKPSSLCRTPPSTLQDKTQQIYLRGDCIGEGGFARCFKATNQYGSEFAMKTVAKAALDSSKKRSRLIGEIKIHQSLNHPNIVEFMDCFEDDVNCYIMLEMCLRGSLADMVRKRKRLSEAETRHFLIQILGAIKYMHGKRVIHRDLKLGNVFLDAKMHAKVGDFGLAALLVSDNERKKTLCGTPNYIAPEVLFDKNGHSFQVDIWSVGVMMFAMLVGRPPFHHEEPETIYKRIHSLSYKYSADILISDSAKDLIASLLTKNPEDRPSLDEIVEHSFFHSGFVPKSIPHSAFQILPSWPNSSPSVWQCNLNWIAAAAGIGSVAGSGTYIAKGVGKAVTLVAYKAAEQSHQRILPNAISPKRPARLRNPPQGVAESQHDPPLPSKLRQVHTMEPRAFPDSQENRVSKRLTSLEIMVRNLAEALAGKPLPSKSSMSSESHVFISKWVDISEKYGLSYALSNGSIGVQFIDKTSLLFPPNSDSCIYVPEWPKSSQQYDMNKLPKGLEKKVMLLKRFHDYMVQNLGPIEREDDCSINYNTYIHYYCRTDRAIFFELSNGEIQINFLDHVKLLLRHDGLTVCILDKDCPRRPYNLSQAMLKRIGSEPMDARIQFAHDQIKACI